MTNRDLIAGAIMAAVCLIVLLLNRKVRFDPDVGGYVPRFTDKATYPKEYVHLVTAFAIIMAVSHLGVNYWVAAVVLAPFVWGYEWSQGFKNKVDMIFGWCGILLAVILLHVNHG